MFVMKPNEGKSSKRRWPYGDRVYTNVANEAWETVSVAVSVLCPELSWKLFYYAIITYFPSSVLLFLFLFVL